VGHSSAEPDVRKLEARPGGRFDGIAGLSPKFVGGRLLLAWKIGSYFCASADFRKNGQAPTYQRCTLAHAEQTHSAGFDRPIRGRRGVKAITIIADCQLHIIR
jgi:hypothetical protein